MARTKTTQKALLLSVVSLLICCAMLAGTTFAWFSDVATSGTNQIIAGNLDIALMYRTDDGKGEAQWQEANDKTKIFNFDTDGNGEDDILWEPGAMWYSKEFKVANVGNLALTYVLDVVKEDANQGEATVSLLEVVDCKIVKASDLQNYPAPNEEMTQQEREKLWNSITAVDAEGNPTLQDMTSGVILPNGAEKSETDPANMYEQETDPLVAVLYWHPNDDETDNKYNMNNGQDVELSSDIKLSVYATQTPYEDDTFGPNYDDINLKVAQPNAAGWTWLEKGNTTLTHDVVAAENPVVLGGEPGDEFYLDMNGKTISPSSTKEGGIFTVQLQNGIHATIDGNGTFKKANVTDGSDYSMIIMDGASATIKSGTFEGIYVYTQPNVNDHAVPALVIEGGTFEGYINVGDQATAENTVVINGGDFANCKIQEHDKAHIQLGEGLTWQPTEEAGYVTIVAE